MVNKRKLSNPASIEINEKEVILKKDLKWNYHERFFKSEGVISQWIEQSNLCVKGQARLERALDQLRSLPKTSWSKPSPASNIGSNIYVIRFKDQSNKQLRLFGHFFDDHQSFVMTFNGFEKDDVYKPSGFQSIAENYRDECNSEFSNKTRKFKEHCFLCKKDQKSLASEVGKIK